MLCDVCSSMFSNRKVGGPHHRDVVGFQRAAEGHCQICVAAYVTFSKLPVESATAETFTYEFEDDTCEGVDTSEWGPSFMLCIRRGERQYGWHHLKSSHEVIICPEEEGKQSYLPQFNTPKGMESGHDYATSGSSYGTSTRDGLPVALRWLTQCQNKHVKCGSKAESGWKPKRLLQRVAGVVRVIDTESESTEGPYAALSHCWGTRGDFIVLQADNISALTQGILESSLPQNFRDALDITDALQIRYLWIDSLCILQAGEGSQEDWLLHSSSMTSVYANCIVNIATHNASTPTDSAFTKPQKQRYIRSEPTIMWHGFSSVPHPHLIYDDTLDGHGALLASQLSSRAWVYQERVLAPRIVHMGHHQILWECSEVPLASECFPSGIPDTFWNSNHRLFTIQAPDQPCRRGIDGQSIDLPDLMDQWCMIVNEYSCCSLTFPFKDKFVALAGVAKKYQEAVGDEYVAGFFRSSILWHLLWIKDPRDPNAKRYTGPYRAPTWSWLSIDGRIYATGDGSPLLVSVSDLQVKLADIKNPWGPILAASIELHGLLLPMTARTSISGEDRIFQITLGRLTIDLPRWAINLDEEVDFSDQRWGSDSRSGLPSLQIASLFALPITHNGKAMDEDSEAGGLILEHTADNIMFQRVGTFADMTCRRSTLQEHDAERRLIRIV